MTFVRKMIYVAGIQFYNTSSVYSSVCLPPKSPSLTISIFLIICFRKVVFFLNFGKTGKHKVIHTTRKYILCLFIFLKF